MGDDELGRPLLRALSERSVGTDLAGTAEGHSTGAALIIVSPDPKDDYLVALARASNADSLVSGDSHLLDLDYLPPLMAVTPRDFLEELERSG